MIKNFVEYWKQRGPSESTAKEVSFKWSHHRVFSTDSKDRIFLQVSKIESGCKCVMNDGVLWGEFKFWICGQNPMVWPFKRNLFGSTFIMVLHFFNILQYLNLENRRVWLTYCLWYSRKVGQQAVPRMVLLTSPGCACVPGKPSPVLCLSASARKYSQIVLRNTTDLTIWWWWRQWKCYWKIELTLKDFVISLTYLAVT